MESRALRSWELVVQVCLPVFTLLGFVLISIKLPQYGVAVSLFSQIFWLYSAYRAWRSANQWGMLLNSVASTAIFAYGVFNYWVV